MPPLPSLFLLALTALPLAPAATDLRAPMPGKTAVSEQRQTQRAAPRAPSARGQLMVELQNSPPLALLISAGVGYAPGPAQWSLFQGSRQSCGAGTSCNQPQHSLMDQFNGNPTVATLRSKVNVSSMDGVGIVWLSPYNQRGYHPVVGVTEHGAILAFGGPW